jgi:hypothetical protein
MESGVKARHLRQPRVALADRLDQLDLARQVVRIVRDRPAQFPHQRRTDPLRRGVLHPVHHPVADRPQPGKARPGFEPVHEPRRGRAVIGGRQRPSGRELLGRLFDDQLRALQADPVDLSQQHRPQVSGDRVHRKADARGAGVDREDTGRRGFHDDPAAAGRSVGPSGRRRSHSLHRIGRAATQKW